MRNVFYLILALVMVTGCTKQGSIADLSQDTAAPMASYPVKTTPVDADSVLIVDSADLNRTKRATLDSLPGTGYTAGTNIDITTGVISVTGLGAAFTNLVTNGHFTTNTTGWTSLGVGGATGVSSGRLRITPPIEAPSYNGLLQEVAVESGESYGISYYAYPHASGGDVRVSLTGGATVTSIHTESGKYSTSFVATSSSVTVLLRADSPLGTAYYGEFDNVEVYKTYTAGTGITITGGVIASTIVDTDTFAAWDLDYADLTNTPTLGAAASLGATNGTIGDVVVWVDDGSGNASLPIDVAGSAIADAGSYYTTDTIEAALQEIGAGGIGGDTLADLSCTTNQIAKWNGTAWACAADATAAGAGYVSTPPTYSDSACTAGQYAFNTTTGYVCVASGDWNTFTLTNWSAPTPDTTPDAFSFTNQTDVAVSETITSARVQITGINTDTEVSATGGTAAICTSAAIEDCGTFGAAPGDVTNNQYVAARHTSSASASTAVDTVVTVGTMERTFRSTTAAAGTTYSFLYDVDHASGDTYAYLSSGSVQGTGTSVSYPAGGTDPGTASSDGGNVLKTTAWNGGIEFSNTAAYLDSGAGRVSFEYRAGNTLVASGILFIADGTDGDSLNVFVVNTDGQIRIRHRSASGTVDCQATSTATISQDTWVIIQARWDAANDTCGVKVGDAAWVDTSSVTGMVAFGTEPTTFSIARDGNNGVANPSYFDAFTIWDTYAD